jgi:hypothetical protein
MKGWLYLFSNYSMGHWLHAFQCLVCKNMFMMNMDLRQRQMECPHEYRGFLGYVTIPELPSMTLKEEQEFLQRLHPTGEITLTGTWIPEE